LLLFSGEASLSLEAVSKPQIAFKKQVERSEIPPSGAQADEKAQHTRYVSILKLRVRWGFETASREKQKGMGHSQ
jgi:hypothetical protein